jgi:hypothetical protein
MNTTANRSEMVAGEMALSALHSAPYVDAWDTLHDLAADLRATDSHLTAWVAGWSNIAAIHGAKAAYAAVLLAAGRAW